MKEWLYGNDGYYSNYKTIGKNGDFYTAVSTSSFFGGSIGKKIVSSIKEGFLEENTSIIEIGSHHGYLLADIIQFIFTLEAKLVDTLEFIIIEKHEKLRIKQQEYFYKCFGDKIKLFHYTNLDEIKRKNAFIVANEIFDAFPCDLVYTNEDNQFQKAFINNHKITFLNNTDDFLINHCEKYNITKGEVAYGYEAFALSMIQNIQKFEFVTFDYGEQYPRNDFSCRVYLEHNVFPIFDKNTDLEKLYKNSDITYDVHFQYLIDCFKKIGVINTSYTTQLKALVEFGIIDLLEILHQNVDEKTYLKEVNKAKTLLNPTSMGDRFKMASFRYEKII